MLSFSSGIALAFIARERGYKLILTMPETMSVERRMMLLGLGAEVVLTPKETAVSGSLAKVGAWANLAIEVLLSAVTKGVWGGHASAGTRNCGVSRRQGFYVAAI